MKINKTDEFIEVIGHYGNEVQCAKMTLLADLYAIEHRDGYAKFPIECEDKLRLVDLKLEFMTRPHEPGFGPFYNYFILNGITKTVQSSAAAPTQEAVGHLYITYHNNNIYGTVAGMIPTTEYVLTNGELILENVNPEYTGNFFENKHGSGTEGDPYYLVEDEVVTAGYFADFTTHHTEKSTNKVSVDLTTLPGWSSLSSGSHNITIVAKADGYRDSEPSAGVEVTKSTWTAPTIQLADSVVSTPIVEGVTMYKVYSNGSYIGYVDANNTWHGEVSE